MCLSICLIIAVAVERYLAVCRPHHFREVQGRSNRVIMYILPTFLVAVAINVTKFFEIEVVEYCVDYAHCGCGIISGYIPVGSDKTVQNVNFSKFNRLTDMRLNKDYIMFFHLWTWIFVTGLYINI